MPDLQLVRPDNPHRSKTKRFAVAVEHAVTDVKAAYEALPADMAAGLQPHIEEFMKKANNLLEVGLILGYRKGLVDFFEDEVQNTTT